MKKDRRVIKTKAAIKKAFTEIIKESDEPKITVTELAKRANINRKTFYLHYSSIEDLMDEYYKELVDKLVKIIENNDVTESSFDVTSVFDSLTDLLNQEIDFYGHLVKNPTNYKFWTRIKNIIKEVVKKTISSKLNVSEEEMNLYAEFYSAGTTSAYLLWLSGEVDLSKERFAHVLGTATFRGAHELLLNNENLDS